MISVSCEGWGYGLEERGEVMEEEEKNGVANFSRL